MWTNTCLKSTIEKQGQKNFNVVIAVFTCQIFHNLHLIKVKITKESKLKSMSGSTEMETIFPTKPTNSREKEIT